MFRKRMQSMFLTLTLVVFSLGMVPIAASAQEMVTDPTTGKMVLKPQYGGMLTVGWSNQPEGADPSVANHWAGFLLSGVSEKMGGGNWGLDRSIYDYSTELVADPALHGHLSESWEFPDPTTIVFHIRQGVNWHDKEPMNGRALTAEDIEYNYHRLLALGSGFTELPPYTLQLPTVGVTEVTAVGNTVVFKLKKPSLTALRGIVDAALGYMLPPEIIKEHGDVNDWKRVVGTGPYQLSEWVDGSSVTWNKNPNYWGFDEKFPENRLPYIDEIRALIIRDETTRLSALRTGKIDFVGHGAISNIQSFDVAKKLAETNPELIMYPWYFRSNFAYSFNLKGDRFAVEEGPRQPWHDIRVRAAMQMALDLETIDKTFLSEQSKWVPSGVIGDAWPGYYVPFEEWPENLKAEFSYNPEGAEKLLDEAGYPRGADGIRFKTSLDHVDYGQEYSELAAAYWSAIGIEVDVNIVEGPTFVDRAQNQKFDALTFAVMKTPYNPVDAISWGQTDTSWNRMGISDPIYDMIYDNAVGATNVEDLRKWTRVADLYAMAQHWYLWGPSSPWFQVAQPYIIGFNGEVTMGGMNYGPYIWARLWIDEDMKKEMGQ